MTETAPHKTDSAAQVSQKTSLERLSHMERLADHIGFDHMGTGSFTAEIQDAINELRLKIRETKSKIGAVNFAK